MYLIVTGFVLTVVVRGLEQVRVFFVSGSYLVALDPVETLRFASKYLLKQAVAAGNQQLNILWMNVRPNPRLFSALPRSAIPADLIHV